MLPAQISTPTWAALLPRGIWFQTAKPFTYVAEFLPIAAAGTPGDVVAFDITIQNDSDFLMAQITGIVTDVANVVFVDQYAALIRMEDTGAGRNAESRAQPFENVRGTAQLPFYLPVAKLVDRGGTLTTTITSLDAANIRNVRLSYHGFKLFGKRPSDEEVQKMQAYDFQRLAEMMVRVGQPTGM